MQRVKLDRFLEFIFSFQILFKFKFQGELMIFLIDRKFLIQVRMQMYNHEISWFLQL